MALADAGNVLSVRTFPHGLQHASQIITYIDEMCREIAWSPAHLQEIYVSVGPGSFTGLRVGITVAKSLAMSLDVCIVAVPSVNVLAENAPADAQHLIVVLDAKRDQIFTAGFKRTNNAWEPVEEAHLDSLTDMLARAPRPVHLIGEGIPYHQKFMDAGDASIISTPPESWQASATTVARLGWKLSQSKQYADPYALTPIYIRRPEAEEVAERAEQKQK